MFAHCFNRTAAGFSPLVFLLLPPPLLLIPPLPPAFVFPPAPLFVLLDRARGLLPLQRFAGDRGSGFLRFRKVSGPAPSAFDRTVSLCGAGAQQLSQRLRARLIGLDLRVGATAKEVTIDYRSPSPYPVIVCVIDLLYSSRV